MELAFFQALDNWNTEQNKFDRRGGEIAQMRATAAWQERKEIERLLKEEPSE